MIACAAGGSESMNALFWSAVGGRARQSCASGGNAVPRTTREAVNRARGTPANDRCGATPVQLPFIFKNSSTKFRLFFAYFGYSLVFFTLKLFVIMQLLVI